MTDDLLTLAREHDLPPRWDGRLVIWLGWEYVPPSSMTMFHNTTRDACEGCGMPTVERGFPCWSSNWGMIANSPTLTLEDYRNEEDRRARLPERLRHKVARHFWRSLCAWRCHHCQLDTVWETESNEMWTLDHTDYGDDGST